MNQKPSGFFCLEKAIQGFIQYKVAEGLSPRSITSYQHDLGVWIDRQGDVPVQGISSQDLTSHMTWLRTGYQPRRFNGKRDPLSPKTLRNHWVSLSAFFTWACNEFDIENPMKRIPAPKIQTKPVNPFTKHEIEALVKASQYSREARTEERQSFVMRRPTARRDKAIILTLLDTGLRAGEFCALQFEDIDLDTGRIEIKHGARGGAKGGKGRSVYIGRITRKVVWRYLAGRDDLDLGDVPLFSGSNYRPMNTNSLRQIIKSIGDRAEVPNSHPHRFRHTFAITFLRLGGDIFTLQALLGHSTLEMVKHYARVAEIDIEKAHRKSSPVDNWRL